MSYYIEDDCKVIRTPNGYIFMSLGGDNNVTTSKWVGGNRKWVEVRARNWCGPRMDMLDQPESVILKRCRCIYGDTPEYEAFKRNGKWVYHKEMERYYRNGMRRAQPLEDIIRANPGQALIATVLAYDKDYCSTKYMEKWLYTTDDLENWLAEARIFCDRNKAKWKDISIYLSFCGEDRLVYAPIQKAVKTVVKHKSGGYLSSYIPGKQLKFSSNLDDAVVFASEDEARTALAVNFKDIRYVSLESQRKAAAKTFVLLCDSQLGGLYFSHCTSRKLYTTTGVSNAMHFSSENEAIRYVRNLRDKGYSLDRVGYFELLNTADGTRKALSV